MKAVLSLVDVAEKVQELLCLVAASACPERKGGYLCIMEESVSVPLILARVGEIASDGKSAKYFGLAGEKAKRLWLIHAHSSSWQSRDEKSEQYGGAIRVNGWIFSFSGLTESADEALSLALAYVLGLAEKSEISKIGRISSNPHLEQILELVKTN